MPEKINADLSTILEQVLNFMRQNDAEPFQDTPLQLDGKLHRYRTKNDKAGHTSGAYCIHTDGVPAGFVQDWRTGFKGNWVFDTGGLSREQRAYYNSKEFQELAERKRQERELEEKQRQGRAITHVRDMWEHLKEAPGDFPYLQKKRIYNYGFRTNGEKIAVPLRDINGVLFSLQWISPDGFKTFHPDAPINGIFWSIGADLIKREDEDYILIGEGVATMAKVYELTQRPCVAALSCNALEKICGIFRAKYPEKKIIILSDNDAETEKKRGFNYGIEAAKNAVKKNLADGYIFPKFETPADGTDWDDYALKYGDEVCEEVLKHGIETAITEKERAAFREKSQKLGVLAFETFASFCKPPKGEDFIISDWLRSESFNMLFAPSAAGKGFVLLDMAFSVACKHVHDWHGKKIKKHGTVIYLAGEGQRGLKKRCAALAHDKGIDPADVDIIISPETLAIDDPNPERGYNRLIANIGAICPHPELIIIDTLNCYMNGNENDSTDTAKFIRGCKAIMNALKCSILLVHHTGQNPDFKFRARGSSLFKDAVDMEYKITKTDKYITLFMTKNKDDEEQRPITFTLRQVPAPNFVDEETGEVQTSCVLDVGDYSPPPFDASTDDRPPKSEAAKEKKTRGEVFALETFSEAAKTHGAIIRDDRHGTADIAAVNFETWRETFYRMSSADNENTRRSAFSRARRLLVEEKKILFRCEIDGNEFYCLTPTGDDYEAQILKEIRQNEE